MSTIRSLQYFLHVTDQDTTRDTDCCCLCFEMASRVPDSLIGLTDGPVGSHQTSFLTNKVGGEPDWPPLISRQLPRCGVCGTPSAHLVQVYCPLEASPYHRNLHLFACPRSDCSGLSESWSVLRSQTLEAAEAPCRPAPPQEAAPPATAWCESADDWGMEADGWGSEKQVVQVQAEAAAPQTEVSQVDVSRGLQDLSLAEPKDIHIYRPFFISVVEESDLCGDDEDLDHAQELLREYEKREGVAAGGLEGGRSAEDEKYEKTRARHGDAVFSRFMKTILVCPQQILRYCRGGTPLFISKPPSNMARLVPSCSSCGASRTFELQLMPALVSLLQRKDGGSETELEFGTVLVYTCANSCWTSGSDSAVQEFCFVQADPDQQLFK
ncbi:programmed cell death protein 2-like [Kryptolebias marmoratus]|uniref:Programmed cell death 2-like n=1 Tax=Kryptolebias marmoratus TaxID=37003 RepID=A0A3Q3AJL4_KRYMA|nr:programmed cell death protein 2-like [Kryptolebias marmoratus]